MNHVEGKDLSEIEKVQLLADFNTKFKKEEQNILKSFKDFENFKKEIERSLTMPNFGKKQDEETIKNLANMKEALEEFPISDITAKVKEEMVVVKDKITRIINGESDSETIEDIEKMMESVVNMYLTIEEKKLAFVSKLIEVYK